MYKIDITKTAQKKLARLPKKEKDRISEKIDTLASDPRPPGCKKLMGRESYRIRIGNYRVIYNIQDHILTVLIVDVGDRKEIYE